MCVGVNEFVPLSTIAACFTLGLETASEHVERPFGYDTDDLDLDGLCDNIRVTVQDVFDCLTGTE